MTVPTRTLCSYYWSILRVDVERFFEGIECLQVLRCPDTGYGQYFPCIAGDSAFYEALQKHEWYYPEYRWVYGKVLPFLRRTDKVLEIGCGSGHFLKLVEKFVADVEGLELNLDRVKYCRNAGMKVYSSPIQDFSQTREEYYDVICAFEVIEHIPNIKEFIIHTVRCLKRGGLLILSFPNSSGQFFKHHLQVPEHCFDTSKAYEEYVSCIILNSPPHHVGLWDAESIVKVLSVFGLSPVRIMYEPVISRAWIKRYFQIIKYEYSSKAWVHLLLDERLMEAYSFALDFPNKVMRRLRKILHRELDNHFLESISSIVRGHSMAVIMKKAETGNEI